MENIGRINSTNVQKASERNVFGTKEWSAVSVNCINGCSHNCRYCYTKYNAVVRFKRIALKQWPIMQVRIQDVKKRHPKYNGTVMFGSTHDITPEVLKPCTTVMENLANSENSILIVSKPHLDCISAICKRFENVKDLFLFRFTIGADDDGILRYWKPGAPGFEERILSLKYAYEAGFKTSVSVEPMLDAPNVLRLVKCLSLYVTDSIWIGKLNGLSHRVSIDSETDRKAVARIRENHSDYNIRAIFESLRNDPKIKWKESIKKVVGLKISTEPGADI